MKTNKWYQLTQRAWYKMTSSSIRCFPRWRGSLTKKRTVIWRFSLLNICLEIREGGIVISQSQARRRRVQIIGKTKCPAAVPGRAANWPIFNLDLCLASTHPHVRYHHNTSRAYCWPQKWGNTDWQTDRQTSRKAHNLMKGSPLYLKHDIR